MADLNNERKETGVVDAFTDSVKYSLVQQPVLSLAQICDHTFGSNLKEKVTFMDAPKPAEFGTSEWHAQQLGSAVGTLAPFLLVHEGVSRFGTPASHVAMDAARLNSAERALVNMSRVKTAGISGAVYSGLFEPVAENNGSDGAFWSQKFKNAGVSAATFSSLTAGSVALNEFGIGLAPRSQWASNFLRNDVSANALSGFGVGAGNAQLRSLLDGKGFASAEDTLKTGYTFSMVGTALGATNWMTHGTMRLSDIDRITGRALEKPSESRQVAETLQPIEMRKPVELRQLLETRQPAETRQPVESKYLCDMVRADGTREIIHQDGTRVLISREGKATVEPSPERLARAQEKADAAKPPIEKTEKSNRWVEPREPDYSHLPPNERPLNVGSKNGEQIARDMSNFAETPFVLDGKRYASVEGFYVALKYSFDPVKSSQAADMVGAQAKRFGKGSTATEATYEGQTFKLGSPEHHAIIQRAIQAKMEQHPDLAREFMATYPRPITHDLGYPEPKSNLPAKDFARILTDVRQDLIDGKIKLSEATTPGITPPARPISELLAELSSERAGDHALGRYIDAFASSDKQATSVVKVGGDSIVLQLDNGNMMHITNKILSPQLGTRPFDLPMVERGTAQSPGMDVHYFVQPKAVTPVSEAAVRDFKTWIERDGWLLSDGGQHQLGVYDGKTLLLDPFAVVRNPRWR